MSKAFPKIWHYIELPISDYTRVWNLQKRLVQAKKNQSITHDLILFCEHEPVFTLGRSGDTENIRIHEDDLKDKGISLVRIERGGDVTYHGPGQLVAYPIIDLRRAGIKVGDYVTALETAMIRVVSDWKISAETNAMNRGVWFGLKKLGSIGIAVQQGISFHGLALNVNVLTDPFGWIHPCGLRGIEVTSMRSILGQKIPMASIRQSMVRHLADLFNIELIRAKMDQTLEEILGESA